MPYRKKKDVAIPVLQKWLKVNDDRFSRGMWPWLKGKGAFAVVMVAAIIFGPFFATVVIRFLGLKEKVAWYYSFITTSIATAVWVPLYGGINDLIRSVISFLG